MAQIVSIAGSRAERRDLRPDADLVEAVQGFLMEKFGMTKPPIVAGRLLALILELAKDDELFPRRLEIAKQFHCSPFSIDAALGVAMARELLTEHVVVLDATTPKRMGNTVTRRRKFKPTAALRNGVSRHIRKLSKIAL